MKSILFTLLLISLGLSVTAGPSDSISILNQTNYDYLPNDINLNLTKNTEMISSGSISLVSGLMLITFGSLLESKRIDRNQPEIYGYSARANRNFNYLVIGLGCGFTLGGGFYIVKGFK